MANLAIVDALVLVVYIAGVVALGMWLGRGRQDAKQYLLGDKQSPWWAILGSIVATETSTVTFLSVPGLAFAEGGDLRFLQLAIGYIVGRSIIVFWLLPLYFRGELFSAYDLISKRFGEPTRKAASLIFLVTRNLGDGLRLFLTAVVLEATLGWPLSWCVVAIGVATIVFTVYGGMKSVIWNDCLQLIVYMLGGLLALLLIVNRMPDGFAGLFDFANESGRAKLFDFAMTDDQGLRLDEAYTFWAGLIGGAFLTLGTHGTDQMLVQRALAARSQADAGRALIASGIVVFIQFALFLWIGVALARFYGLNPPDVPFENDRVFSSYIVSELPKGIGLIGLLLAAVFSAAISTLSSSLNSSATSVVSDWILPARRGEDLEINDAQIVWYSRMLTVLFGVVQVIIGIWAASWDNAVVSNALAIAGFAAGLLLGLFALCTLTKKTSQIAALAGLLGGLAVLLILKFGSSYAIGWPWLPVIGSTTTFAFGLVSSFLFGEELV